MAIDFQGIEDAVKAWLSNATGVQTSRIIFSHEKTPGLDDGSFLTLKFNGPFDASNRDEVQNKTDLSQAPGQEVQQTVIGLRELVVSVQAYTLQEQGAGTAKELLGSARTALSKPSQRAAFNAAGFSFVRADPINNLPQLGPEGEGRANMDVHLYVFDSVVDPVGYIATSKPIGTYS